MDADTELGFQLKRYVCKPFGACHQTLHVGLIAGVHLTNGILYLYPSCILHKKNDHS